MKTVKTHLQETNPDRVAAFEKEAAAFAKQVIGNFKDYEFYVGESMNPDGMVALLNYREDGTTPCELNGKSPHHKQSPRYQIPSSDNSFCDTQTPPGLARADA